MSANMLDERIDDVKKTFAEHKGNIRCDEARRLLETLGFSVKEGKRGGHRIFTHSGLPDFYSGSYNCGHGKNPEIKPAYIQKILRVINEHEADLKAYMERGEQND